MCIDPAVFRRPRFLGVAFNNTFVKKAEGSQVGREGSVVKAAVAEDPGQIPRPTWQLQPSVTPVSSPGHRRH